MGGQEIPTPTSSIGTPIDLREELSEIKINATLVTATELMMSLLIQKKNKAKLYMRYY